MTDGQPANISYSLQENQGYSASNLSYEDLLNEVTTSADAIPDQESDSECEYDYSMESMVGMDDYIRGADMLFASIANDTIEKLMSMADHKGGGAALRGA